MAKTTDDETSGATMKTFLADEQKRHDPKFFLSSGGRQANPEQKHPHGGDRRHRYAPGPPGPRDDAPDDDPHRPYGIANCDNLDCTAGTQSSRRQ